MYGRKQYWNMEFISVVCTVHWLYCTSDGAIYETSVSLRRDLYYQAAQRQYMWQLQELFSHRTAIGHNVYYLNMEMLLFRHKR